MQTIFFFLLMLPLLGYSQDSKVFIKLIDQSGRQITGECTVKGFERWIQAETMNSSGKNSTQLSFTMPISSSSGTLKSYSTSGNKINSGQISVMANNGFGTLVPSYIISMEKINVLGCAESMGCNGVMSTAVILQTTRIGWTYYQSSKSGMQTVANKYGWDAETNTAWTNF